MLAQARYAQGQPALRLYEGDEYYVRVQEVARLRGLSLLSASAPCSHLSTAKRGEKDHSGPRITRTAC